MTRTHPRGWVAKQRSCGIGLVVLVLLVWLASGISASAQSDSPWSQAIHTPDGHEVGVVTANILNIRSAPSPEAPIVETTYDRYPVIILDRTTVPGWYQIGQNRYVSADWVKPFVPTAPPKTYTGHWVDVNLSQFFAVAYDGAHPVYAAIITAGRDEKTPPGTYQIFARVEHETMDSATVGIPKGDPHYYYLENVPYTQYFKAGAMPCMATIGRRLRTSDSTAAMAASG